MHRGLEVGRDHRAARRGRRGTSPRSRRTRDPSARSRPRRTRPGRRCRAPRTRSRARPRAPAPPPPCARTGTPRPSRPSSSSGSWTFDDADRGPERRGLDEDREPERRDAAPRRPRDPPPTRARARPRTGPPAARPRRTAPSAPPCPSRSPSRARPRPRTARRPARTCPAPRRPRRIGPCRTGKHHVDRLPATRRPRRARGRALSTASSTAAPAAAAISGMRPVSDGQRRRARQQVPRPSRVMPIGTTSDRSGSRASITERAETHEISCSAERPPNSTATRRGRSHLLQGRVDVLDQMSSTSSRPMLTRTRPSAIPARPASLRIHLAMRGRRGVTDERVRATEAGRDPRQLQRVAEPLAALDAAGDLERDACRRIRGQNCRAATACCGCEASPGYRDALDLGMAFEGRRERHRAGRSGAPSAARAS